MNKFSFYYIAVNLLLFSVYTSIPIAHDLLIVLCVGCLFTVGIAHGAIDHVLFGAEEGMVKRRFIIKYLLVSLAVTLIWFVSPNIALLLFLVLSAYHFGQSQFVDYKLPEAAGSRILYFSWGLLLFALLFYIKSDEISLSLSILFPEITIHRILIDFSFLGLLTSFIFWAGLSIFQIYKAKLPLQDFLSEVYLILLISLSFYVFPTLIGFSLYFIILHSLRSMKQEYNHLFAGYHMDSIWKFVKLLFPFTMLSIAGSVIIIGLAVLFGYKEQIPFILLVLLSSVTTPHTFAMDYFLEKRRYLPGSPRPMVSK